MQKQLRFAKKFSRQQKYAEKTVSPLMYKNNIKN
jgi:hypothetical protein